MRWVSTILNTLSNAQNFSNNNCLQILVYRISLYFTDFTTIRGLNYLAGRSLLNWCHLWRWVIPLILLDFVAWFVGHAFGSFTFWVSGGNWDIWSVLVSKYSIIWVNIYKFNCYLLSICSCLVKIIRYISSLFTEWVFSQAGNHQSWLLRLIVRSVLWQLPVGLSDISFVFLGWFCSVE